MPVFNSVDFWARRPPPEESRTVEFYADESSQQLRHLVIGAITVSMQYSAKAKTRFAEAKGNYKHELKWTKVSKHNLKSYESWVDEFFHLSGRTKLLGFYALVLDTSTFNHKKYNEGDGEIGFSKILYQLLLHSIGRNYGYYRPIVGYLDHRDTVHSPEKLRQMLNAGLLKIHPTKFQHSPFRSLTFLKSEDSELIQLADILIGAIAFNRNLHGTKANSRPEKLALSDKILARINTKPWSWNSKIWNFKFNS